MINKRGVVIVFLVMIMLNIVFFYKINLDNYHDALLGRALVIKDIIEKNEKENGKLPESLYCCLADLKATAKEMYIFSLDVNEKLAFVYEYDYVLDSYTLIIGDRYPPNLIYIFKNNQILLDSDMILKNGL